MLNRVWQSWGVSIIGPSHSKTHTPNQDAWLTYQYEWGNIVVISDGLGSKLHSDKGSQAACIAVCEAINYCQNHKNTNVNDILRLIHAYWLVHLFPLDASDCSATCLFAIESGEQITLARLGDGMIVAVGNHTKKSLILNDNKFDSFSNYTNCLQNNFKPEQWEVVTLNSTDYVAIVLCTDGIVDDLLPEKQIDFAQELYESYVSHDVEAIKKDVKSWLNEWPVPLHTDDKTIACLFYKDIE